LFQFSKCNSLQVVLRKIQNSWLGGHIEDTLSVILTIIFGFSLFDYTPRFFEPNKRVGTTSRSYRRTLGGLESQRTAANFLTTIRRVGC